MRHRAGDEAIPPRRGPSLRKVGAKLPADRLLSWIRDPGPRRPGYRMPQLWPDAGRDEAAAARMRSERHLRYTVTDPPEAVTSK